MTQKNPPRCPLTTKRHYPNLNDSERRCEVPDTRALFVERRSGTPCAKDSQCHLFHSKEYAPIAKKERRFRDALAELKIREACLPHFEIADVTKKEN
jgi:hypothetical protein